MKKWWKLDDHKVEEAEEKAVFQEAFGGEGYKSACNIFYANKDIINKCSAQVVYSADRIQTFRVPDEIKNYV